MLLKIKLGIQASVRSSDPLNLIGFILDNSIGQKDNLKEHIFTNKSTLQKKRIKFMS